MKSRSTWMTMIGAVLIVLLMAAACGAADKVHQLSLAIHDPATSDQTIAVQAWANKVKEASGGRIDITVYPGGTIASTAEELDAVKSGAADIAWIYTSLYPGQFPITDALTLPLIGVETPAQASRVLWDLYEENKTLRNEIDSRFQPLMMYTNPLNNIITNKKEVKTANDLKGLKVRCPGGTPTDMMIAWGGMPVMMGPGDIYQSLERGVLDGFVLEYAGTISFKLNEVSKYYLEFGFFAGPFLILMNKDSFNKLPTDLQEILLRESGRDQSRILGETFQKTADDARKIFVAAGGVIVEPKGADLETFKTAAKDYAEKWVEKNKSDSFDSRAYFNRLVELLEKYKGK